MKRSTVDDASAQGVARFSLSRASVRRARAGARGAMVMACVNLAHAQSVADSNTRSAADSNAEPSPTRNGAAVGAQVVPVFSASEICSRDDDAIGCETGRGFLAIEGQARFSLGDSMTLGPFAAVGIDPGGRAVVSSSAGGPEEETPLRSAFGAVGVDLRLSSGATRSFWWGPRLGLVVVRDEVALPTTTGYSSSAQYFTGAGPGIGVGYDLAVTRGIDVTFTLRGDYVFFPGASTLPENGEVEWNNGLWLGLGLGMLFGV